MYTALLCSEYKIVLASETDHQLCSAFSPIPYNIHIRVERSCRMQRIWNGLSNGCIGVALNKVACIYSCSLRREKSFFPLYGLWGLGLIIYSPSTTSLGQVSLFFPLPLSRLTNQAAVATVSQWETEETNFEGLRVKVDEGEGSEGWLMNRMSLHEPIVIFNVESVRRAYSSASL